MCNVLMDFQNVEKIHLFAIVILSFPGSKLIKKWIMMYIDDYIVDTLLAGERCFPRSINIIQDS